MDITYTSAVAPTLDHVRSTSRPGCRLTSRPRRSFRGGEQEPLLEARATQLAARRRRTAWRSLRVRSQRLDRIVLEPIEGAEPCVGLAQGEQLGVDLRTMPHLCEEDADE